MARHVRGVTGLLNNITVRPPANPAQVQTLIEEMFKRQAEVDALRIRVEVCVASVQSHLVIAP